MADMITIVVVPDSTTKTVILKGEWDNWSEISMKRKKDGSWYVRKKIPHGSWQFGFLCDGIWSTTPEYSAVSSPFGTENNRITTGGES